MRLVVSSLIILFAWSCDSNSKLIMDSTPSQEDVDVSFASVFVPVDSLGLAIYMDKPSVVARELNHYFVYWYNQTIHTIDVYDLSNKHIVKRIKLYDEGPNAINGKIYHKYIYNQDSVFIMTGGKLSLIDLNGSVLNTWNIMFDPIKGITDYGGYFHSPNEASFKITENLKYLQSFFIHNNTFADVRNKESMDEFIIGKMSLETNDISFYPISYSPFIKAHTGDFSEIKPNISYIGDKIYYNWPIESNIYIYDFESSEILTVGAKSAYSQNLAPRRSENLGFDYRNNGTWFNAVHKYPGKPYFYRTHWGSQDETQLNGEPSDALTKPGFLMIFDEDFKLVEEIELEKNCHLELSFATDEGVYFWSKDGKNENEMKFCRYTIE